MADVTELPVSSCDYGRFSKLPYELRELIWRFAIEHPVPMPKIYERRKQGKGRLQILRLNRTIHEEIMKIAYAKSTLFIDPTTSSDDVLKLRLERNRTGISGRLSTPVAIKSVDRISIDVPCMPNLVGFERPYRILCEVASRIKSAMELQKSYSWKPVRLVLNFVPGTNGGKQSAKKGFIFTQTRLYHLLRVAETARLALSALGEALWLDGLDLFITSHPTCESIVKQQLQLVTSDHPEEFKLPIGVDHLTPSALLCLSNRYNLLCQLLIDELQRLWSERLVRFRDWCPGMIGKHLAVIDEFAPHEDKMTLIASLKARWLFHNSMNGQQFCEKRDGGRVFSWPRSRAFSTQWPSNDDADEIVEIIDFKFFHRKDGKFERAWLLEGTNPGRERYTLRPVSCRAEYSSQCEVVDAFSGEHMTYGQEQQSDVPDVLVQLPHMADWKIDGDRYDWLEEARSD